MRKIFAPCAGLCLALVSATQASAQIIDCAEWQEMATFTMQMRQTGVPIYEVFDTARKTQEDTGMPEGYRKLMDRMILNAYNRPLERTERGADVAAIEFGEELYGVCVSTRSR
ncbi:MAG: hypothetical protein Q4G26_13800 [Paracoccus sp. (in: a-proteobacteria)]|nr:hypothetical protein [Paracoccus sp. (in: a-proteobacteria)]